MQMLYKLSSSAQIKAVGIKEKGHCQEVMTRINFSPDWLEQDTKQDQSGLADQKNPEIIVKNWIKPAWK